MQPSPRASAYLPPPAAPHFLQHVIMTTLQRKGFQAAEAGAIAEIERLLERHVQSLFELAHETAEFAGRSIPHSGDLLFAHDMNGDGSFKRLNKESKRRRVPIPLTLVEEPPSPKREMTLGSLPDLEVQGDRDRKPELSIPGRKLEQAFEGAPDLPEKWTYAIETLDVIPSETETPAQLSSSLLDFIKLTATERGDIPPELGLVDYRRTDLNGTGGPGKKRRIWGVKGVGVNA